MEYRTNRLNKAVENASFYSIKGALYPWKSGQEGTEQSYREKYDPVSQNWLSDYGYLQRHINLSVAYNIIHYYKTTNDHKFLYEKGIYTLFEICRFWANCVEFDRDKNRYNIKNVIGPDEFHIKYQDAYKPGIHNNAYTNFMIVWLFTNVINIEKNIPSESRNNIREKLKLENKEIEKWKNISMFTKIEISDDEIIEQYQGFFKLQEIDWNEYKRKFKDLHNIDKIFTAEGKSTNDFQIIKQADALLPFYFLTPEEIRNIMFETGYLLDKNFLNNNFKYYYKRTSHTSLLSKPVHSLIAYHNKDFKLCNHLFMEALEDIQILNKEEIKEYGVNLGVAGALLNIVYSAFAGITCKEEMIYFSPKLPGNWHNLNFKFHHLGNHLSIDCSNKHVKIESIRSGNNKITACINGQEFPLSKDIVVEVSL